MCVGSMASCLFTKYFRYQESDSILQYCKASGTLETVNEAEETFPPHWFTEKHRKECSFLWPLLAIKHNPFLSLFLLSSFQDADLF